MRSKNSGPKVIPGSRLRKCLSPFITANSPWVTQLQQKHAEESATRRTLVARAKALGLTARESQVAVLLAYGCSAKEIATKLGVTLHTARRHTESVLRKAGVDSRSKVASRLLGLSR